MLKVHILFLHLLEIILKMKWPTCVQYFRKKDRRLILDNNSKTYCIKVSDCILVTVNFSWIFTKQQIKGILQMAILKKK